MSRHSPWLPLVAAISCAALSGCVQFSRDGGFGPVADATRRDQGADAAWPRDDAERAKSRARVADLLGRPLGPQDAVQIALLNNPGLQAEFENLGISEADLIQAGRLPNPRVDLLRASKAGQYDIEETLSFNVLSLLSMPLALAAQRPHFAAAQQEATAAVARLALKTRLAYYDALAADQALRFARQVQEAASLGATLGARMQQAGNWNLLDQAHEQAFYIDAVGRLQEAQARQIDTWQQLLSCLGLQGDDAARLTLAAQLPELPGTLDPLPDVERAILERRLDLKSQRLELDALAHRLKLTRATRFINVLDAGATRIKQGARGEPYEPGFVLGFEIPVFDSGAARVRRAEALYRQAADRFAQSAIEARADIRRSYALYQARYEIARRQHDDVLPLRQAITEENVKRYNASQASVFDLLGDAREQAASVLDYIESVREFWNAKSQLDAALLGAVA